MFIYLCNLKSKGIFKSKYCIKILGKILTIFYRKSKGKIIICIIKCFIYAAMHKWKSQTKR